MARIDLKFAIAPPVGFDLDFPSAKTIFVYPVAKLKRELFKEVKKTRTFFDGQGPGACLTSIYAICRFISRSKLVL